MDMAKIHNTWSGFFSGPSISVNTSRIWIDGCFNAMAMTMETVMHSLKSTKNILTFPASSLEVACPGGEVCEAGPNKVAGIGKNICSALAHKGRDADEVVFASA